MRSRLVTLCVVAAPLLLALYVWVAGIEEAARNAVMLPIVGLLGGTALKARQRGRPGWALFSALSGVGSAAALLGLAVASRSPVGHAALRTALDWLPAMR
jgi:hypothetical protein